MAKKSPTHYKNERREQTANARYNNSFTKKKKKILFAILFHYLHVFKAR